MNTYRNAIALIGTAADLIMIFGIFGDKFVSSSQKKYFSLLFLLIVIAGAAKWGAVSIESGLNGSRFLHIAAKFFEFSIAPFVPAVCASAFCENDGKLIYATPILNLVLQICSLYTGGVFYIDGLNVYVRGAMYPLYQIAFLAETMLLFWNCFKFSKKYYYNSVMAFVMLGAAVFLCIVIQEKFNNINLEWTCVSFAAIIFYIYHNQLIHQIDDLTCLLNRKSYDVAAGSLKKDASITFIDVDDFKNVNDTYGHIFGDESLRILSAELINVFEKYGCCYRIGGDEFCVILKKNIGKTEMLLSEYSERIKKLQEGDSRIPSVSLGFCFFDSAAGSIEDTLANAERMMYKHKQEAKK